MIVIADDITGAAEMAGIAFERGQQVRLQCGGGLKKDDFNEAQVLVIATDTRSMSEQEATAECRRLAQQLPHPTPLLFKKVDSALRGHVVSELTALLETTDYERAVYLPANPSKERTIQKGTYYINGQPIHETAFSYDPEFPATTSILQERFPDAARHHILMPDAESLDEMGKIVDFYQDRKTLFAGGADLFALLCPKGCQRNNTMEGMQGSVIMLCGSTQSQPMDIGLPIVEMPLAVYDGEQTAAEWLKNIDETSLILTIPYHHRTGKATAVYLRSVMAEVAKGLITRQRPDHLIIEGGATAWATLQALGWKDFTITHQIAPGVVQMSATNGTLVTLKPGSYPWQYNTQVPVCCCFSLSRNR